MSTTQLPTGRTAWQRWTGFWFTPQDPVTLGFMRIITGLLILYIHLAYSLDFQAFFGNRGWWAHEYAERERKELPAQIGDFWSWDENKAGPRLPDAPHRRQAVLEFVKISAEMPPAERKHALRLLDRLAKDEVGAYSQVTLNYLGRLGTLDRTWDASLNYLVEEKWPEVGPNEPEPLRIYPPPEWMSGNWKKEGTDSRTEVADEIRSFRKLLPKDPDSRKYVYHHFAELNRSYRRAFVDFLEKMPSDPTERAQIIAYLDYWNTDPRDADTRGAPIFSVWFHITDPTEMAVMHAAMLVVFFLFTIGFCTRVMAVLTWFAILSYIQRSVHVLFGQDTMMNILVIYLMIGNSGAALSVDRLIARYRATKASLARSGTIDAATRAFLAAAPLSSGAGFGIRLVQIHFCFIYLASGLSKLKGSPWWNGTAFWDVMVNPEFTLMRYQWFESLIRGWASLKPLYYLIITISCWFTLALEISFAFLVWTRMRIVLLWAAILLHALIGVLMGLNLFELMMMVMLLAYFPPGVIRDRLKGSPDLPKLAYSFDPANPESARGAALIEAVDVEGQVNMEPKKGATPTSNVSTLFTNLRLLRPVRWVLWIPGMKALLSSRLFPTANK